MANSFFFNQLKNKKGKSSFFLSKQNFINNHMSWSRDEMYFQVLG